MKSNAFVLNEGIPWIKCTSIDHPYVITPTVKYMQWSVFCVQKKGKRLKLISSLCKFICKTLWAMEWKEKKNSLWLSVNRMTEHLVQKVHEKVEENSRSAISSFSNEFSQETTAISGKPRGRL